MRFLETTRNFGRENGSKGCREIWNYRGTCESLEDCLLGGSVTENEPEVLERFEPRMEAIETSSSVASNAVAVAESNSSFSEKNKVLTFIKIPPLG